MRLLIDANIILDVLEAREPHLKSSSLIWKMCETGEAEGYVSALTFANLVYLMRKELNPEGVHDILRKLQMIFQFADLKETDLQRAAEMEWKDFEDAVQCVTAGRIDADFIVTRNVKDFIACKKVPAFTPDELLSRYLA